MACPSRWQVSSTIRNYAHVRTTDRLYADQQRSDVQQDQFPTPGSHLSLHKLQIQLNIYNRIGEICLILRWNIYNKSALRNGKRSADGNKF